MYVTAERVIRHFGLVPLPGEGGMFRQSYVAGEQIPHHALPARYLRDKPFSTAIYYLLTDASDSFSALHRLPTDEVYHFYAGDPVGMLLLHPDGQGERVRLGADFLGGAQVQLVVPRGTWQGARLVPGGSWTLLGTTMAPGFTDADYEAGERADLLARYPAFSAEILNLTRE
jgi:predicted cupin superfamily sugar epimerase